MTNLFKKSRIIHPSGFTGTSTWSAPSNIALVKYWGKGEGQIPLNPNISMTLSRSVTATTLRYTVKEEEGLKWRFIFEGKAMESFHPKIDVFFTSIREYLPYLRNLDLVIESENTFPHSSGIASSASSMMSLACCLVDAGEKLTGIIPGDDEFRKLTSFLARLGSGSASRSAWPGFSVWGSCDEVNGSSDIYAVPVNHIIDPWFYGLRDAILIVSSIKKKVSSSKGHGLMIDHPYAAARYKRAEQNLSGLLSAMKNKNPEVFTRIVENEALDLHGLMMSSDPGFTLLHPKTLQILDLIRTHRQETGIFSAFTLDAGPNVHLLYHESSRAQMELFIDEELLPLCEGGGYIHDKYGDGPLKQ
jgi:diphosphomevalonate decarboxylase